MLSDNLLIEESDQLRRMDVGEVMEVFQGFRKGAEGSVDGAWRMGILPGYKWCLGFWEFLGREGWEPRKFQQNTSVGW